MCSGGGSIVVVVVAHTRQESRNREFMLLYHIRTMDNIAQGLLQFSRLFTFIMMQEETFYHMFPPIKRERGFVFRVHCFVKFFHVPTFNYERQEIKNYIT